MADPLEVIIDLYCSTDSAPNVVEQVRANPIEGIAFAIGGSMGAISNMRRLFESRPWSNAELMRMERDLIEARDWLDTALDLVRNRKAGL